MPNAQKQGVVADLRTVVSQSKGAILTDYRSLTVAEVTNLRKKLRELDAEYHIVKNTLFKIAIGNEAITPELESLLTGPTAIVFARNDVVAPTKAVLDFLRDLKRPEVKVKGGWIDGKVYGVEQVTALSKLPPKEQIISQLIGTLNGPVSQLVGTFDNILASFVRTIQAIHDKKAEGGGPVEASAEAPAEASTESPIEASVDAPVEAVAETPAAPEQEQVGAPIAESQAAEANESATESPAE